MADTSERNIVFFDNDPSWTKFPWDFGLMVQGMALEKGWWGTWFTGDPWVMAEDITERTPAIVTTLGGSESLFGYSPKARPILDAAHRLGVPLAIVSGHPHLAADYIRPDSQDVLIPKQPLEQVAPMLGQFFDGILAKV